MDDEPDGLEEMRAQFHRLRAEVRDMRDDLEYHLMVCPAAIEAAEERFSGAA